MSMGKFKKYLSVVAVLAAVALVVTGCGASTTTTGGGTTGGTAPVSITIGIGAPITQGATALGLGMERGAKLAIADMNKSPRRRPPASRSPAPPVTTRATPRRASTSPTSSRRTRTSWASWAT